MGLTVNSTGKAAEGLGLELPELYEHSFVAALAGNPNVGKSTLFNKLTGMNQHTGNWSGKTVTTAFGLIKDEERPTALVDIPGAYSLEAHSAEEEVARDFVCFGKRNAVIVVCDAGCLERNLGLVLQTAERTKNTVICVNLIDEAEKKGVFVDTAMLSQLTGLPAVGVCARSGKGLSGLKKLLRNFPSDNDDDTGLCPVLYGDSIESAALMLSEKLKPYTKAKLDARWLALRILCNDAETVENAKKYIGTDFYEDTDVIDAAESAADALLSDGYDAKAINDAIASEIMKKAAKISSESIFCDYGKKTNRDEKIDRLVTGKFTAFPIMFIMLAVVFWLTVSGANIPSAYLSKLLTAAEWWLSDLFACIGVSEILTDMLVHGSFRVLSWVVAVMLPPMAIFFPLFTLLEDAGFLPRVAFNLDRCFAKCHACGKQALTTCMGFG